MGIAHILRENKKTCVPSRFIFFDTETTEERVNDEKRLELKLGVACYARFRENEWRYEWMEFKTRQEFFDFVFSKTHNKTKLYLIAHNISFDFRVLGGFEEFKNRGYLIDKLIYNGTSNIWKFSNNYMTIELLDNMNFFKSSLKILGESIGIKKLEVDFTTVNEKMLFLYCRTDVLIIVKAWKILLDFITENDLGDFASTIAAQALNAYKHRFMKEAIYIHNNSYVNKLERNSYHGGRTECFYIGIASKQKYYLLDVNSMYPSVMKFYEYPTKLIEYKKLESGHFLPRELFTDFCVIATAQINTLKPIFPLVYKNKLIFPIGKFITVLTTRELIYAYDNNLLVNILNYSVYKKAKLFIEYVDFFYNKRLEYKKSKNEAFSYLCKIYLNSLYGKFGQRNEKYMVVGFNKSLENGMYEYFDIDTNLNVKERVINGKIERSLGLQDGIDTFVSIPAHITADARMKLWEYIEIAGRENVFYCDTDSIIVNETGYNLSNRYISKELGFLSLKEVSTHLVINGLKDYEFKDSKVIKGIKDNAKKLSENTYEQTVFEGLAGAIRKNRINEMYIHDGTKTLKRKYDKGVVYLSGVVKPITINELL